MSVSNTSNCVLDFDAFLDSTQKYNIERICVFHKKGLVFLGCGQFKGRKQRAVGPPSPLSPLPSP